MAITHDSVAEFEEMIRLGILTEHLRVVLIREEIVPKCCDRMDSAALPGLSVVVEEVL